MLVRNYKIVDIKRFEVFVEDLEYGENNAIVKIDYGAICKADIRYYLGKRDKRILDLKYPLSLIHEATGTVLRDYTGKFAVNDKVCIVPNIVLKKCSDCNCDRNDLKENYCPNALFASSNSDGFSRDIISFPSSNLVKIDNFDIVYTFCELISVGIASLRRVDLQSAKGIAIFGDGILSYILCSIIKCFYSCKVFIIGKHLDKIVNFSMCNEALLLENSNKLFNRFEIGIECVGGLGAPNAINDIINNIKIGGEVLLTGVSESNVPINTRKILEKGLIMKGSTRSNVADFENAVSLLTNEKFYALISRLILGKIKIEDLGCYYDAFEKECTNTLVGKYILEF